MNDDFNTANAISVLYELVKEANLLLETQKFLSKNWSNLLRYLISF